MRIDYPKPAAMPVLTINYFTMIVVKVNNQPHEFKRQVAATKFCEQVKKDYLQHPYFFNFEKVKFYEDKVAETTFAWRMQDADRLRRYRARLNQEKKIRDEFLKANQIEKPAPLKVEIEKVN
jgi:hypothetical protein